MKPNVLAEFFELAPFGKPLLSTDPYLLPEPFLVGAGQFRHSLQRILDEWRGDDAVHRCRCRSGVVVCERARETGRDEGNRHPARGDGGCVHGYRV